MEPDALLSLVTIVVLGIGAQWLAWRLRLPSILLLLGAGLIAGPAIGWLEPASFLSDEVLFAFVTLSVGLILFEGGLSLRLRELTQVGKVVFALCSIGAAVTWVVGGLAAYYLLGLSPSVAMLQGALLVVTGPTVIGPLLLHLRPERRVATTLKWEGILIDPVGAIVAVLVLETMLHGGIATPAGMALGGMAALGAGTVVGIATGILLTVLFKYHWIPDNLQNPFSLMLVVVALAIANRWVEESGLVAVTVMGVWLANQRSVDVRHIVEFKENLRVLLLGSLFILLAARVQVESLQLVGTAVIPFVLVLVLVARPLSVWVSTIGAGFTWRERAFLAWMAPRGIVAAAVSSLFALRLVAQDPTSDGRLLVPVTFVVIVATVAIYGLTAGWVGRRLGLTQTDPQGVLIVGLHPLSRAIANLLQEEGFPTLLVDTNRTLVSDAKLQGLRAAEGNVLAEHELEDMDLAGIGRALAMTRNDEANSLVAMHCSEVFGRGETYQLVPDARSRVSTQQVHGRLLFAPGASYNELNDRFAAGAVVKKTKLSKEFDFAAFREHYGDSALPMFRILRGNLRVYTADVAPSPDPGSTLIILVDPTAAEAEDAPTDDAAALGESSPVAGSAKGSLPGA